MLIVGRFVVGIGIGLASMSVPIYIAEVAPSGIRGALVSSNILMVTSGQFACKFDICIDGCTHICVIACVIVCVGGG